jgi:hypothetical protein
MEHATVLEAYSVISRTAQALILIAHAYRNRRRLANRRGRDASAPTCTRVDGASYCSLSSPW